MKSEILIDLKDKEDELMEDEYSSFDVYMSICEKLKKKYGLLNTSYDDQKNLIKRGEEWLDIHHISEMQMDDIAARTLHAIKNDNQKFLKAVSVYNRVDQLCYANKIEHFILHYLIDMYHGRKVNMGGCWLLLPQIFDIEYKTNFQREYLIKIQKDKHSYYDQEDLDYLFELAKDMRYSRYNNNNYDMFIQRQAIGVQISDLNKYLTRLTDPLRALMKEAYTKHNTEAQVKLGLSYLNGTDGFKDVAEGKSLLETAAEEGNIEAIKILDSLKHD